MPFSDGSDGSDKSDESGGVIDRWLERESGWRVWSLSLCVVEELFYYGVEGDVGLALDGERSGEETEE